MDSIKVKNLSFSYGKYHIFDNLSFVMPMCSCSIIGPSSSGKTTLLKLIAGQEKGKGNIYINAIELNDDNFNLLRRYIAVVFKSTIFVKERVIEELRFPLENIKLSRAEITKQVNKILEFFNLGDIKYRAIDSLNYSEKLIVKILSYLIMNPRYIALDDLLTELNDDFKQKLISYLNINNSYLINVTTEMEELLLAEYIICLYGKNIAFEGYTKKLLTEERLFKRLGMTLPFFADLSLQLKYYGLIDKIYNNSEDLVAAIWR